MAVLSFQFDASHADMIRVMPRMRREIGINDTLVVAVFLSFIVCSILLSGFIGRLIDDYFVGIPTVPVGLAVGAAIASVGWAYAGVPWVRRRQADRVKRLCPDTQTHFSANEDGVTISDDRCSTFWRWTRIHRAVSVPEGVLVLSGTSGCLVPARAFVDADKQVLVDYINSRAAFSVATSS